MLHSIRRLKASRGSAMSFFLCVGDTAMAEKVILSKDGIIEGGRKGMVVVDASIISPSASCRIGETLAASGIDFPGARFQTVLASSTPCSRSFRVASIMAGQSASS